MTNSMRVTNTLFLITLLTLFSSRVGVVDEGKHLFLLSGQSNMKRFQYKQFFLSAVHTEYGAENVIVIKTEDKPRTELPRLSPISICELLSSQ